MAAAVEDLGRYPDSNGFELKAALAVRYDVPTDWITLGNGSNDILELAAAATLTAGRSCIYAQHSFAVYALATQARGARAIVVPARQLGHDLDAMLAAIAPDTALIYIANPNNPTGTHLPAPGDRRVPRTGSAARGRRARRGLQRVSAAGTARRQHRVGAAAPNVIVSRTFSKAFGLAGLRVGYGLAQRELTDLLNRVRQPFNVSTVAQAAAVAALADEDFLARSYALNLRGMQQLTEAFRALGLEYVPSVGNFVLVKVGAAAAVYHELLKRGVIVRPVANYGLPEWLRVTVGLPEENAAFLKALPQALAAARG